jgi:hypothetical protein
LPRFSALFAHDLSAKPQRAFPDDDLVRALSDKTNPQAATT